MERFVFMTVSASLLIAAGFLLRALGRRKIPRGAFMALWCAASLRLLLPLEIALPVSFFSLLQRAAPAASSSAAVYRQPAPHVETVPSASAAAVSSALPSVAPVPAPAAEPMRPAELLMWIWITGAAVLFGAILFSHLRERRRCRLKTRDPQAEALVPGYVRVYRCESIGAPYVAGLLRPKVLLPVSLPPEDLAPVLSHEVAHIRGLDILKKYLFAAALCVNWFNPLVWIMVRTASHDLELLCDERALRGSSAASRTAYAHALLNAEERRTILTLSFNKNDTEVRIMNILNNRKPKRFVTVLSALLVALLVAACASAPAETKAEIDPSSTPATTETPNAAASPASAATASPAPSATPEVMTEDAALKRLSEIKLEIEVLQNEQQALIGTLETMETMRRIPEEYTLAALEALGETASDMEIWEESVILWNADKLKKLESEMPAVQGDARRITVLRTSDDSVLGTLTVPAGEVNAYFEQVKSTFIWSTGIYYSITFA